MSLFLDDGDVRLYHGDALEVLRQLPDGSVDCVVTSPPYWGLRDYGTGEWDGGDPDCDHVSGLYRGDGGRRVSDGREFSNATRTAQYRDVCGKCGARRVDQQLGLEPTPDLFVANMVAVFREIRRVLADHGTCWVNLGDSYAADRTYQVTDNKHTDVGNTKGSKVPAGLKQKDLVGIPWRVAFALQADGWWLRSDIIWAKPNPMPESVTDRPTKAHEYVFLLTKNPRYWFDTEAVREEGTEPPHVRPASRMGKKALDGLRNASPNMDRVLNGTRNVRSVWQIATQPYPEAHFATFPEELACRCILAGTSEKGKCPECGAPWARETQHTGVDNASNEVVAHDGVPGLTPGTSHDRVRSLDGKKYQHVRRGTDRWSPSCNCSRQDLSTSPHQTFAGNFAPVPCVVLDPFIGSGTVAKVARDHQRHAIGIDLNQTYLELAARRLQQLSLLNAGSA